MPHTAVSTEGQTMPASGKHRPHCPESQNGLRRVRWLPVPVQAHAGNVHRPQVENTTRHARAPQS